MGTHSEHVGLAWEVVPAERKRALGQGYPQGMVVVRGAEEGDECIPVPACVARMLIRRTKADAEPVVADRAELDELLRRAQEDAARERIARMLERRDYARSEVEDRLRREGFSPVVVGKAVDAACRAGLISDARYADAFIRTKVLAGWGASRIARELSRRGIDTDALEGWPYDYLDPDDELDRACEVASRKRVREPNAYAKLVRFLMGRGFSYAVSTAAAKAVLGSP